MQVSHWGGWKRVRKERHETADGGGRKPGMRTAILALAGFLAAASIAVAGADPHTGARGGAPTAPYLPGTLDSLYPPAADRPVYLLKMLELETAFSGIVVDLMEEDFGGARGLFEEFRARYREAAAMVPEWGGEYPEKPVEVLGAALAAGDKALAMGAFAAVGETCHRCHLASMVPVQQKYHWGDFGSISVRDPLSGAPTGYGQFKKFLAANLAGITVDLRQGQTDNARKQFEGFRARFSALGGSCGACHEKESRYYVDRDVQETVAKLGKLFQGRVVPAEAAMALAQEIGRESCSKCHLVHVPAALAKTSRR